MKIGLILGILDNDFCNSIVKYASKEISSRNAQLIVIECCDIDRNNSAEISENLVFKILESECLDGIIIVTSTVSCKNTRESFRTMIKNAGIPAVSAGDKMDGIPSLVFDYKEGFNIIISHFISHKINKFAFVSGPLSDPDSLSKFNAFSEAAEKHGLDIPQHFILAGTDGYMPGYNCARKLVPYVKNGSVEAVICSDDELAISVIKYFKDNDINIPGDVAVSGYNNTDLANYNKTLTTVDRHLDQLFEKAAAVLFEQIFRRNNDLVFSCPPELVTGQSCGCDIKIKPGDSVFYPWTRFNGIRGRIAGSDNEDVISRLTGYLEDNNIAQCYVVQNSDPAKYAGQETPKGTLFFGYAKGSNVSYPKPFSLAEILPRHILYDIKEPMVIKPLSMNNMQYGFLFVSISDSMASFIDDLASELSQHFAYLYTKSKQKRLEKEIADAHESLMISNKRLNELTVKENLDKLINIRHLAANMLQSRMGAKGEYVLIIVEIDNFNEINSRYGFSEGEFVISCVSNILSNSIRDDDFLSHQYCERYVLLVKNIHKDPTGIITKRFIKALDELNSYLKKPYTISFSWGYARTNVENDFEKAYNAAEHDLLQNKQKILPRS